MPISTTGVITAQRALIALDGQPSGVTRQSDFAVCGDVDVTRQFKVDLSDADAQSSFTLKVAAGGDVTLTLPGEPGIGNVIGPATSTNNAICRYDGGSGGAIQDSPETTLGDTGTITSGDGTPSVNGTLAGPELYLSRNDDASRQIMLSNGSCEMSLYLQSPGSPAVLETATTTDLAFQVNNSIWTCGFDGIAGTTVIGGFYNSANDTDYVNKATDTESLRVVAPSGQTANIQTWELDGTGVLASVDKDGKGDFSSLSAGNGASGSWTAGGKTVTVVNGIITSIV